MNYESYPVVSACQRCWCGAMFLRESDAQYAQSVSVDMDETMISGEGSKLQRRLESLICSATVGSN